VGTFRQKTGDLTGARTSPRSIQTRASRTAGGTCATLKMRQPTGFDMTLALPLRHIGRTRQFECAREINGAMG
jgi:hypothetical protein